MSGTKRKDVKGTDPRPAKKARPDSKTVKNGTTTKKSSQVQEGNDTLTPTIKAPVVTRLKEEEPLFPRGGGSILSPLEHKQIQVEAQRDALFEDAAEAQNGSSDAKRPTKKRKKASKTSDTLAKIGREADAVRIEGLSIKRMVRGMLVLAQITEITDYELTLALPNNITGHVSITAVSDAVSKRVEAEATEEAEEQNRTATNDGKADSSALSLQTMFSVGQYVRASVLSTMDESTTKSGKSRKKLELSLRPEDSNAGLKAADVVKYCTVMASITSVEDHGYLLDLGVTDSPISGFLAKSEVDTARSTSQMQPGSVILCTVIDRKAKNKVVQLSAKLEKLGNLKHIPHDATTISTLLPGTAVEVLTEDVPGKGVVGKVMGSLDVTADIVHSGAGIEGSDLEEKYKIGSKFKARVICTFPDDDKPKLGISMLEHVTHLKPQTSTAGTDRRDPLDVLPVASFVEACQVTKVESGVGLFVDVGVEGVPGFVHISQVKDGKVDALYETSGSFKVGSKHRGRVVGYNTFDGLFLVSFEQSVLTQTYLRVTDVPIGEVVNGVVDKLILGEDGVRGLVINLDEGFTGFVPETHMSDVQLQHPEKKFRAGLKVKARVLSVNADRHQLLLTLKKTLVSSDAPRIKSLDEVEKGMRAIGTVLNILDKGAIIQFYGTLRGFLPVSEMSEAYVKDPKDHFRKGQVVNVHVLDVDPASNRLVVSCKDSTSLGADQQQALQDLAVGQLVSGKVSQKSEDDLFLELDGSLLKATLSLGHLTDKSLGKSRAALKRIHVGQILSGLVVLELHKERRAIVLSQKPSLVEAAKAGKLLSDWDQANAGDNVPGFVRNITATAVFVQFANVLTAILPSSMLPQEQQRQPDFDLHVSQSILVTILSIDREVSRAVVAVPSVAESRTAKTQNNGVIAPAVNAVDQAIASIMDVSVGMITKARIASVKSTQLNVRLADNIQGRIDVSQVFDAWEDIPNKKKPLQHFKQNQIINVRVLGVHDARSHRFLPISHRSTHSVLELSMKPSDVIVDAPQYEEITLDKLEVGQSLVAFVNNIMDSLLWASITPNVRGRIAAAEASDDLTRLSDLGASFPIGSALRVRVTAVDPEQRKLDLSAKSGSATATVTWQTVQKNLVLTGMVTKVTDRQVFVHLSDDVSGPVHLIDLDDDFEAANPKKYVKSEFVRVAVVDVDVSNKRLRLSMRPSRVLSSSLPVVDKEVGLVSDVKEGDIVRGFVKNVADKGLFVALGGDMTAFVKISDVSDSFLKEWKAGFQIDQLVKGRITSVDTNLKQISMSLKESVVSENYVAPLSLADLTVGQNVTGKIRAVEEFGVFILVDKSANLSGLCHRTEMAEKPVKDARTLYNIGDAVKARVLKVDVEKKRLAFGLKASYFADDDDDDDDEDENMAPGSDAGAALDSEDNDSDDDAEMDGVRNALNGEDIDLVIRGTDNDGLSDSDGDEDGDEDALNGDANGASLTTGLEGGAFDWTGDAMNNTADAMDVDSDSASDAGESSNKKKKKKKRRKAEIEIDRTGDLDANGPQSISDFERLLLGQPDSSALWRGYMAFQLQVGDQAKAREVAERAIQTINIREETEKLNMWIAYLNLENAYGTDESLGEVFARACQYNDEQEVHERLTSIYIQSGKRVKADELFQAMLKKFGGKSQQVWTNYAHFLYTNMAATDRARALLPRATQVLEPHTHVALTTKFASLEFRTPHGDAERGRTLFEGLLATYPKKLDLWGQLLDLEIHVYNTAKTATPPPGPGKDMTSTTASLAGKKSSTKTQAVADPKTVRDVFERGSKVKGLKPRAAMAWFRRWATWEGEEGDARSKERVMARTREWTRDAEGRKKAAAAAAATVAV